MTLQEMKAQIRAKLDERFDAQATNNPAKCKVLAAMLHGVGMSHMDKSNETYGLKKQLHQITAIAYFEKANELNALADTQHSPHGQ